MLTTKEKEEQMVVCSSWLVPSPRYLAKIRYAKPKLLDGGVGRARCRAVIAEVNNAARIGVESLHTSAALRLRRAGERVTSGTAVRVRRIAEVVAALRGRGRGSSSQCSVDQAGTRACRSRAVRARSKLRQRVGKAHVRIRRV